MPFSTFGLMFTKLACGYLVVGMLLGSIAVILMLALGHFTGTLSISRLPAYPGLASKLLFGIYNEWKQTY